ncbi:MAG: deoxyribose-phosphate aldolase [Candidatus Eremiobacteraeota bacterium]|nr:deoxyribose-phosphate aldolase [Candidatus Eremiobacteraeota bacterium]MBV8668008.1 deoxyribose-phosphate aldolase [Candidatus Eremiobacteraeota bacterium]
MAFVPVDAVGLEERAAVLATRSIKRDAKVAGLRLAIGCMDLTTLEGKDTPERVNQLCRKAQEPDPADPLVPPVAAVCVYPNLVTSAKAALQGSPVQVASVATAFPSGQSPLRAKLEEVHAALEAGADEIDMVIDRGAFLAGRYHEVAAEIAAVRATCSNAVLKVILETGELGTYDAVRRASWIAMEAGADFIKTSTGKIAPAATLPVALEMLLAARDFEQMTGRVVGVKVAGGIRTAKQALQYLVLVKETRGEARLHPRFFRIGASSLIDDALMQLAKERTGAYQALEYFPKD